MFQTLLLAALIGGPASGPEVDPPVPDSIPPQDVAAIVAGEDVPAAIVPRASLLDAHPAPPPPPADLPPPAASPAVAERSERVVGVIMHRADPQLVAVMAQLQSSAKALTLPVQPIAPPPAAPAPPAPALPSPQVAPVKASPQSQAIEAPAPPAAVPVQPVSAVVQPGPLRRLVGIAGEGLANVGRPRVYYPRPVRQRTVRVTVPAPQISYGPVAAPAPPAVQPLTAPTKGGY